MSSVNTFEDDSRMRDTKIKGSLVAFLVGLPIVALGADAPVEFKATLERHPASENVNAKGYAEPFLEGKKLRMQGFFNLVDWNAKSIELRGSGGELICTLEPKFTAANMPGFGDMGKGDSTCILDDGQVAALMAGKVIIEIHDVKHEKPVLVGTLAKVAKK